MCKNIISVSVFINREEILCQAALEVLWATTLTLSQTSPGFYVSAEQVF